MARRTGFGRESMRTMANADQERWDRRYATGEHGEGAPPAWLDQLSQEIPVEGRALDLAAGTGRIALWLARHGLSVRALDISPVGLARCREKAQAAGLALETAAVDLEENVLPLDDASEAGGGMFEVISCFHYLHRDLFRRIPQCLTPGGILLCELATRVNLERHEHPSPRFLVETNELLRLCAPLQIVYYREGWIDGRSLACVLARRPGAESVSTRSR